MFFDTVDEKKLYIFSSGVLLLFLEKLKLFEFFFL